jgi:predicted unusual protein kinase regulating ubiquinone biosynthesis (AarF/ABC1/UbiB family)
MLTTRTTTTRGTFTRRFRLLKAYRVAMRVLLSYLWLKLTGWVRGPDWADRRRRLVHQRNARRVVQMILELKGLFIKVGQMISILTNFLPEDFRQELEALQDQIPPRPLDEIVGRIEDEFGRPPGEMFASFDPTPLASASLAQVHRATLHDGREVAVKVQHLDIEEVARLDLHTIRNLLGLIGAVTRVKGIAAQYNQIQQMILAELDFVQEAHHIEAIAANFKNQERVSFPEVAHEYSSERVLTTEFIDAVKVTNLAALDAFGIDRQDLARRVVEAYCAWPGGPRRLR